VIRVHRIPFSTNVERVALAAGHKGLAVDWIDHAGDDRSGIVEVSGQILVPVAELDGEVIRGSMRIVERIEAICPGPPLYSSSPGELARARVFVEFFDRVWKGPPNLLDADVPPPDAEALSRRLRTWTGWFEDLLADAPYLGGDALGVADVCAFPFLKYATLRPAEGDDERFHAILSRELSAEPGSNLAAWINRVNESPRA
jgi:glutathione S-transferase